MQEEIGRGRRKREEELSMNNRYEEGELADNEWRKLFELEH